MKKRFVLLSMIFAMTAMVGHAQIYQIYSQNFETGSPSTYTTSPSAEVSVQSNYSSEGSGAIMLHNTSSGDVTLTLDTIDFSAIATFSFYTLEFSHIAFVNPTHVNDRFSTCAIFAKLPTQAQWTQLTGSYYNMQEGGTTEFPSMSSFSTRSYQADWHNVSTPSNLMWKSERFDLDQIFQGVDPTSRKLIIKFVVNQRQTSAGASAVAGWYIDDIRVRASSQQIVAPRISMKTFPDALNYPNSRGARIAANISTMALQGINNDSVYVEYTVGNSTVPQRVYMQRQGSTTLYKATMPFFGYDTLIHYHLVVKDSTMNENTAYYPKSAGARITYRNVRGKTNSQFRDYSAATNNMALPFSFYADTRSEFIYDSTEMSDMGFRPGAITSFQYRVGSAPRRVVRDRVQIRIANVDDSYVRTSLMEGFYSLPMQVVYDSVFVIEQASANAAKTIQLQDTFFYSGSGIVVQFINHNATDPQGTSVKHIPTLPNRQSLFMSNYEASMNHNYFSGGEDQFTLGIPTNTRPWVRFFAQQNVPLMTDCGVSSMAYPAYSVPSHTGVDSVVVWLKNFGVNTIDSVRLAYSIDNASPVYYDWTGSLAGGDSVRVCMSQTQNFTAGYHTIRAWVDDTVKVGTLRLRDHEPYNDTTYTPFVSCEGPYSGTITVGTAGATFTTLERCLYVLSNCGVNAPLTVKLAPGRYSVTKFPLIPGVSVDNYVQFEPASGIVRFCPTRSNNSSATVESLVDLTATKCIRFNNIQFAEGMYDDNRTLVLVQLGENSSNCQFLNCTFSDSLNSSSILPAQALLRTGYADSTLVEGCTFYGGTVGIDVVGMAPDIRAKDNVVRGNNLRLQSSTAISVTNQDHVVVDSNFLDDVRTDASYVLLCQYVYDGSRITRNKIYSSTGASCLGVSDMYGTADAYSYVANNMLVSLDDSANNQLTTPLNIIKGAYLRVAFNSVRMAAPTHVNIAAATLGGGVVNNCYFQNNVVASFDTMNFAFAYIPASSEAVNYIDHNCYYSESTIMNKWSGVNYSNLNNWTMAMPTDVGSVSGHPRYINSAISKVDLRSYNELLRNVGVPVPGITNDIFDSVRDPQHPSLGAFEVSALQYDFTPVSMISPFESYCGGATAAPVEVCIRNTGTANYEPSTDHPVTVYYSLNGGPVQNFVMNRGCGAGDTVHFLSTRTVTMPSGAGNTDASYTIRWWVKCNLDPDILNDSAVHHVDALFAAQAPNPITQSVAYSSTLTITPTQGVISWPVSYYTTGNGRQQRSGISWYRSMEDETPFHYGNSYTTETMYSNDTLYISQKRNLPLVKITEVQVKRDNNSAGVTYPMPSWMNQSTQFAVELTNCGDYPANLEGDTVMVIRCNTNTVFWVLPNVTIQPGANLVLQFKTNSAGSDSTRTIFFPGNSAPTMPTQYTQDFAVIYRDGHGVADAVPFNNVITASSNKPETWANQSVPAAVWQGAAVSLAAAGSPVAGASRISWPTSSPSSAPTASALQWQVSSNENRMHIGSTEANLIRYTDNGCEGFRGPVYINVVNAPSIDIAVEEPVVDTGCNLSTTEPVSVRVHNYGQSASPAVLVNFSLDGGVTTACTDTIESIPGRGSVYHTFSTTLDMHQMDDTVFHVLVWVTATLGDNFSVNDTSNGDFLSRYSPEPPYVVSPQEVDYSETLTFVNTASVPNAVTVWSDRNHVILDTTDGEFQTPPLYTHDTFYVRTVAQKENMAHLGTLANNTNNNFPSPYNPKTRHVKEQYIVTAEQLLNAGHSAGNISSLSFYLSSVGNNTGTFTFSDYKISIGTTDLSVFANANFYTGELTQVYHDTALSLSAANVGWVKHTFDTVYHWDGVSNLIIEVTRSLSTTGINSGANTAYTAAPNTVITKQDANNPVTNASGSKGGNRPDMLFGFMDVMECSSPEQMIVVNVLNIPPVDAGIDWDPALDTAVISSCAATQQFNLRLKNHGFNPLTDYTLSYRVDNGSWQQVTGAAGGLAINNDTIVPLVNTNLMPGRHVIEAVVTVTGDTTSNNDTIVRTFPIRFCAGNYTVGTPGSSDYGTLPELIDTLTNVGIAGPVVFLLEPQTYDNQLSLGTFDGAEGTNTITFTTAVGATQPAVISYVTTQASNYVLRLNGARNIIFNNLTFYAYDPVTTGTRYASVINIANSYNITFRNSTIRSKFRNTKNSNLVQLGDDNVYITIDHCLLDSGYYAIYGNSTTGGHHLTITHNDILNFGFRGIDIRNIDTVNISSDSLASSWAEQGKALTGIAVAYANNVAIKKNFIHFLDEKSGVKTGIKLARCRGAFVDRATVYNNMINLRASSGQANTGIVIDSLSRYVNVFFNTVRLYAGNLQKETKSFHVRNSAEVYIIDNIFSNFSQGYAYYVDVDTCVALSDYNVYYSNSPDTNTRKFARWGADYCSLDSLRLVVGPRNFDMHSYEEEPVFVSERDIRLRLAQFSGLAQYNADVPDDVFDSIRPQIPTPTIGAHEFQRAFHNIAIGRIRNPRMPEVTVGANAQVYNIETDSILVEVEFYNNGSSPENNCYWYAELLDVNPAVQSPNRNIYLPLRRFVQDSVKLYSPLGVQDSQRVVVHLFLNGSVDADSTNNVDTAAFFIYPAYDLQLSSIAIADTIPGSNPRGCRMFQVPINYTVKNIGKKDFPGEFTFEIGYDAYQHSPTTSVAVIPTLPTTNAEMISFGSGNDLPVGTDRMVTISPAYQPNLYPTGYIGDMTVKLRGWVHYQHDIKPQTDTTSYINVTSNHTPERPIGHDTMVDYGTYANLYATQNASRTIRWHNDTLGDGFYYNGNNQYARSTHWESRTTDPWNPPYIHDTVFWLSCLSTRNCTSYYSPITVSINPPLLHDVAISEVRSPRSPLRNNYRPGRVYNEVDTVVLRVVNYGSQPISNIPIGFKFMNANGRTTYLEAYDTVRTTIPGRVGDNVQYYDFKFPDSVMLQLQGSPLSRTAYTLNAWVSHIDDQQHNNDTLSKIYDFSTVPENTYDSIAHSAPDSPDGFDITRVSYNTLDHEMPEMIGYKHIFFGNYNAANAEVPTLYMRHGTSDTLTVEIANNEDENDTSTLAKVYVAIDYNRDGVYGNRFDGTEWAAKDHWNEIITKTVDADDVVLDYGTVLPSRHRLQIPLTIPEHAQYGYMRMMVMVNADTSTKTVPFPYNQVDPQAPLTRSSLSNGCIYEFLLFIQEPGTELDTDAALTRVVSPRPRNRVLDDSVYNFNVMFANKGNSVVTESVIEAIFSNPDYGTEVRTFNWVGNLEPGKSTMITFDSVFFNLGTTNIRVTATTPGDTVNTDNDTLHWQYHRYHVIEVRFIDSFDVALNMWYAPEGYNNYTRNYFERATPQKNNLPGPLSGERTYVTDATRTIVTGKRGNRSVLYSPIIYRANLKPDTLTFYLAKDLAYYHDEELQSTLTLEFLNYEGRWVTLDNFNAVRDTASWYDDDNYTVWQGSSNGEYVMCRISTKPWQNDMPQELQFRFVYRTPTTTYPNASFGDGVSIDSWYLDRGQIALDIRVTDILYPVAPRFGETIQPRVRIHNNGYQRAHDFRLAYRTHGVYLPIEATFFDTIDPDDYAEFTFPYGFTVTNDFPDTFSICSFPEITADVYRDNDTACKEFALSPLQHDMYMYDIQSPLDNAVAGDSINVTVRLRNFGQSPVEHCTVSYLFNGSDTVSEDVNFSDYLGHPLGSTEFFSYTFRKRVKASMGIMEITTWVYYQQDTYRLNDTLSKQIRGVNSVADVQATAAVLYETGTHRTFGIQLKNMGARMANNFKVGFWYDQDSVEKRSEEVFYREGGLPSGGYAVHRFTVEIDRVAPVSYVTAYCYVPGDQDRSNDTTSLIVPGRIDVTPIQIEVEENNTDSCRVRMQLTNIGNMPTRSSFRISATINGKTIASIIPATHIIDPGTARYVMFEKKIPKSPTRTYTGYGGHALADDDNTNNNTNVVRVVNYFEGIAPVENSGFTLSQNYPNPFDGSTQIDFYLPASGTVRFVVTDALGRQVHEQTEYYAQGRNTINFSSDRFASGIYYYTVIYNGERRMKKMIIR